MVHAPMDELGLVEAVDGFGESIVMRSPTLPTELDAGLRQALGVTYWADSSGRRNYDLCRLIGETGQAPLRVSSNQSVFRGRELRAAAHGCNLVGAVHAEIGPLREVLAQQSVSVLVGAALPWAVRIARK